MSRQRGYRFDAAPLEAAVAASFGGQSPQRVLGVSGTTWAQYRYEGLSAIQADRLACRIGLHPGEIWADWVIGNLELEGA